MTVDARFILRQRGVIDLSGTQTRPITRDDLFEIIKENGGSGRYLHFRGLDFTNADLRGLDLSRSFFEECNFYRSVASPLITMDGREIPPSDLMFQSILKDWAEGEAVGVQGSEVVVTPTCMEGALFIRAKLDHANFDWVKLRRANFFGAHSEGTVFFHADLSEAILRFALFFRDDLRSSDFRDANLYGFQIDTPYLDDIKWGNHQMISSEKERKWDEAVHSYRMLGRAHDFAGLTDVAVEFRYRLQRAQSSLILDRALSRAKPPAEGWVGRRWVSAILNGGARDLISWITRSFIDFLCGFGERPWRVIRAILLIVALFTPCYFEYTMIDLSARGFGESILRLGRAAYFSASSSTALGYGSWAGQGLGWVKYVGVVQSFLGTFLTALLLVTFARRWIR